MSRKFISVLVAFVLCVSMISAAFAIDSETNPEDPTTETNVVTESTEASADESTTAAEEETTEAGTDESTTAAEEETTEAGTDESTTAAEEETTEAGTDESTTAAEEETTEAGTDESTTAAEEETTEAEESTTAAEEESTTEAEESTTVTEEPSTEPEEKEPTYLEFEVKKEATCTEPGIKVAICEDCGKELYEVIPAKGHTVTTTTVKATTKSKGKIVESCSVCEKVLSKTVIAKIASVSLSNYECKYTGNLKQPKVKVVDSNGTTLKNGKDYTVKYSKGCVKIGTYTVTVKFIGNYSGSKTLTYKIIPSDTAVKKVTSTKNSIKVSVKGTSNATGYKIQYSTNKDMSDYKIAYLKKNTDTAKTIKGLESATKYYVRVRAYKTVNVDGNSVKYNSAWSDVVAVKTVK